MIQTGTALLSGMLFGAGLVVAQMTNPAKVINFLDVSGAWDPSLAFVMGSAFLVSAVAVRFDRRPDAPRVAWPTWSAARSEIDSRLLLGASLFGAGWGLAGFCPGPAIASLVTGSAQVALFVVSMLGGMFVFKWVDANATKPARASARS